MKNINRVILAGILGQDPKISTTKDGEMIVNLSIGTSESWKDKEGQWQSKTEWHKVVCFAGSAAVSASLLKKGDFLQLEGQIKTREWENNGQKRYTTEIIIDKFNGYLHIVSNPKKSESPVNDKILNGYIDENDQIPF